MPPRTQPIRVTQGAGMTAGLEIWRCADGSLALYDRSPDGRFAVDVATWNGLLAKKVLAGLNAAAVHYTKDATKQDAA